MSEERKKEERMLVVIGLLIAGVIVAIRFLF